MSTPKQDLAQLVPETLNTHFAEAYRALRANINFSSIDEPVKTMVVTSASPGEGKTTTAFNLGVIMSQAGPAVLIVDADFRRPSLHDLIQVETNGEGPLRGLSDLIVGSTELSQVILETGFDRLGLVPAGVVPPNPSELLGSQRMKSVLTELANAADIVILDTPPCRLYSDALMLASLADGVIYVLKAGSQDKAAQRRVQKQLEQTKARVLGVVFNSVEVEESMGKYDYYYYNANRKGKRR